MKSQDQLLNQLKLPPSHLTILRIVSAMAWADGNLSEEELNLLVSEFNEDLPINPSPFLYVEDMPPFFDNTLNELEIANQLSERFLAESALKEIVIDYKYHPIPLGNLVQDLTTEEDKSLALKLAYMVIKISPDETGQLISNEEKKVYRQLVKLLNLKEDLVKEIELEADEELEKIEHPFQAFLNNIKRSLGLDK